MPKRHDALLLQDMADNAAAIFQFVGEATYEQLINDRQKLYAVVRAFEIIGEAAKLMSQETKARHPLIEWRLMTDFRNVLIHHYFGIDYEALWTAIQDSLPANYELLKRLL